MEEIQEKRYWDAVDNAGEVKRPATHGVVEFFARQRISYVERAAEVSGSALDVACGTGFSSQYMRDRADLTCVDFSARLLRINPAPSKLQASAYELPFADGSFDFVYGWDFLHHLERPLEAVREMARVSRRHLAFFEPNGDNPVQFLYAFSNRNERGTLGFRKKRMLELASSAGLEVVSCDTAGWVFAGATPAWALGVLRRLPFVHAMGTSVALVCRKRRSRPGGP